MRFSQISVTAVLLAGVLATPALSQAPTPPPPTPGEPSAPQAEALPVPAEVAEHEKPFVLPKERTVSVNLSIDRPPLPRKSQLKLLRSGEILSETARPRPERLEFEILIEGPCGDLPVYLPVCKSSVIHAVYAEYGESAPDKVVDAVAELGAPDVCVVAIAQTKAVERRDAADPRWYDEFNVWTPYYRVAFHESGVPPVMVKVPPSDRSLYRLADSVGSDNLHNDAEMMILTLSESKHPLVDCHQCGKPACDCHPLPHQPVMNPQPAPAQPAGEALPTEDLGAPEVAPAAEAPQPDAPVPPAPVGDDPFNADEA